MLNLDNGLVIRRKVANLQEDGNDCRFISVSPGSDITGTKSQRKIWDQLILPHDKIDSFISAKSPTAQFKEWTDSAAPLDNEREEFIDLYDVYKSKNMNYQVLKRKSSCWKMNYHS